jgi:hypothetical protein
VPLPPAVARAVDRTVGGRESRPILRSARGAMVDRHPASRRLRHLAAVAGVRPPWMQIRRCSAHLRDPPVAGRRRNEGCLPIASTERDGASGGFSTALGPREPRDDHRREQ